jgi:MFS family permease
LFAAIASSVLQGIGESATSGTITTFNTTSSSNYTQSNVSYTDYKETSRDYTVQGGYQMAGWALSIGFGAAAGLIIGLIYKALNDSFQ